MSRIQYKQLRFLWNFAKTKSSWLPVNYQWTLVKRAFILLMLREGLDIREVSLVAIMDADKEGFLRSERSLIQTIGCAARNIN
jgi:hypothetical protein